MTSLCLASLAHPWWVFVLIAADGVQLSSVPQQGSSSPRSTNQYYNSFSLSNAHTRTNTHSDSGALPFPNPSSKHRPGTTYCRSQLSKIKFPEKFHVMFLSLFFFFF